MSSIKSYYNDFYGLLSVVLRFLSFTGMWRDALKQSFNGFLEKLQIMQKEKKKKKLKKNEIKW